MNLVGNWACNQLIFEYRFLVLVLELKLYIIIGYLENLYLI